MAVALRRIRDRVNGRLRNHDLRQPAWDDIEVDQEIAASYIACASRLPAPTLYTASAFTISAGGDTFTLPATVTQWTGNDGGAEYAGDVRIQLASNGQFLVKQPREIIEAYKDGIPLVTQGVPREFALWTENDQDVQGLCYPGALVAQVCNLYRSLKVDDVRDFIGSASDDMDDVEVMFEREAAVALELWVAADLLERMTPEDAATRRLNQKIVPVWRSEANRLLYQAAAARHNVRDVGRMLRMES